MSCDVLRRNVSVIFRRVRDGKAARRDSVVPRRRFGNEASCQGSLCYVALAY